MKTFVTKEKRSAPATRKVRPYIHHPMGAVQRKQRAEIGRILHSTGAQAKLTIGQPNDKYEQEADHVADQVMTMPDPKIQRQPEGEEEEETLQTKPLTDQITPLVQRQEEPPEEEEGELQAKFTDERMQRQPLEEEDEEMQAKEIPGKVPDIQCMCAPCSQEYDAAQSEGRDVNPDNLCPKCRGASIQSKEMSGQTPQLGPGVESRINSLKGGGQPLDPGTRNFFEPRFGYDFRSVRVHHGGQAAEVSRSINARAFTLDNNIVFGTGQYQPQSSTGGQLLGHELTHVVQQGAAVQRSPETGARFSHSNARPGPMIQRACGKRAIGTPSGCGWVPDYGLFRPGQPIFRFNVNCDEFSSGEDTRLLTEIAYGLPSSATIKIHGYASTSGRATFNHNLACARALAAKTLLLGNGVASSRITNVFNHGPTPGPAADRKSVTIEVPRPAPAPPTPAAPPTPTPTGPVCGPDVTTEVQNAVSRTRTTFGGWSTADREAHCDALDSVTTGGYAWDIIQLHNNAWIHRTYRPACASVGATPPCGSTVQVGSDCSYAGSPNYVIYGAMCRLCRNHYNAAGNASGVSRFTHAMMQTWVNRYKGTGWTGLGTPAGNFIPSTQWATAGYRGWPGGSTPAGDRNTCGPRCPTPYTGPAFTVAWWRLSPRTRTVI